MERIKRAIKFQNIDTGNALGIFWGIVLLINILSYVSLIRYGDNFIGVRVSESSNINELNVRLISIAASNIIPILIFIIICCYELYYEYFPIAISFSVTRKDFYKAAIITNLLLAFVFAVIQTAFMKIDMLLISSLGKYPMTNFEIFNISADSSLLVIFSLFLDFLAFMSLLNLLSALNYKLGFKLWIILGVLISLTPSFLRISLSRIIENIFFTRINPSNAVAAAAIIILFYLAAYYVTINTNIKNKMS